MSGISWLAIHLYSWLIRLYPASFREEFGAEMTAVFTELVAGTMPKGYLALIILCLRELLDFPMSLWQEYRHRNDRKGDANLNQVMQMNNRDDLNYGKLTSPTSWVAILAGALPFILFGLMFTLKGIGYHAVPPMSWPRGSMSLYLFVYIVLLLGLGIGWAMKFPRWSYAYLGVILIISILLEDVVSYGFRVFGFTFGDELGGWLAWIPLLLLTAVMLLLTRSLRPLAQLVRGIWHDWTLLSFGLYGTISWLFMSAAYDNKTWYNNTIYLPLNMFLLTLVYTGGTIFYMRCRRPWKRVLALQLPIILFLLVSASIETLDGNMFHGTTRNPVVWFIIISIWFGLMFVPGVLGLVRKATQSTRFV